MNFRIIFIFLILKDTKSICILEVFNHLKCYYKHDLILNQEYIDQFMVFKNITINLSYNQLHIENINDFSNSFNSNIIIKNVSKFHLNHIYPITHFANEIHNSNLDFYFNGTTLTNSDYCIYLIKILLKNSVPFSSVKKSFILNNVTFPNNLCPLIFYSSNVDTLKFDKLINNPNFIELANVEFIDYLSKTIIDQIEINNMNGNLPQNFFSFLINSNTRKISIYDSILNEIEESGLANVGSLEEFHLELKNFKAFWQNSSKKWLTNLNIHSYISNLSDCLSIKSKKSSGTFIFKLYLVFNDLKESYTYPNEDFCYFTNFPHKHMVFPVLKSKRALECTCTIVWLLLNYKLESYFKSTQTSISMKTSSVSSCFENFEQRIIQCNFSQKLSNCGLLDLNESEYFFDCDSSVKTTCPLIIAEILIMIIIFLTGVPIISISYLSLIFKNFKEKMYDYLKIQFFFQMVSLFTLIFNITSKFSSDLLTLLEDLSCDVDFRTDNLILILIKYKFINFLTFFSITCALLATYIMVLDRYLLITNKKSSKLYTLLNKSYSIMLPLIILIGICLNLNFVGPIIFNENSVNWLETLKLKLSISQDIFHVLFIITIFIIDIKLIVFIYRHKLKINYIKSKSKKLKLKKDFIRNFLLIFLNSTFIIISRIPNIYLCFKNLRIFFFSKNTVITFEEKNLGLNKVFWFFLIINNSIFIFQFFVIYLMNKNLRNAISDLNFKTVFFKPKMKI